MDESALTGESVTVEKSADAANPKNSLLFYGTHVASGSATAQITATGANTEYGQLITELGSKQRQTSFEKGTTGFGMLLVKTMVVLCSVLIIFNLILQRPLIDSLLFSLALAVGLTPQLLPAIVSVSLAAGARVLAKNKVLVKRLDAIEDFGSMDVFCTDKTGTLTFGVTELTSSLDFAGKPSKSVYDLALLNASLQQGFESPLDQQIISQATKLPSQKAFGELAYDFNRKRLSVGVTLEQPTLICKGAFSLLLDNCTSVRTSNKVDSIESHKKDLIEIFETQSKLGNRVLAVASKTLDSARPLTAADETALTFEGFLIFADRVKPDAVAAVAKLRNQGIDLYLITGDNALTAQVVASEVLIESARVVTGEMLTDTKPADLAALILGCRVFAEVNPLQKELIVNLLKEQGHTVGFFGDGINDSAALKAADVGISVDTAVDIAKESAAIVLLEKSLDVISQGVRLGRSTFLNTMKYVKVAISASFGNMFSMAIAAVALPFLPLLPLQILLLNFLTDFPALAIASDNVDEVDLQKPHSWNFKEIRRFMIGFGLLSSIFDIATFVILVFGFKADATLFRSTWFVESSLTELCVMLVLRTALPFYRSAPGKGLWVSSAVIAVIVFSLPFSPLAGVLGLGAIPWQLLLSIVGLAATYVVLNEAAKKFLVGKA